MRRLPDSSEYFQGERALQEEVGWVLGGHHKSHLRFLEPRLEEFKIESVVEFGCGTGLLAQSLPASVETYQGVDKSRTMLDRAVTRNASPGKRRHFTCWCVRNYEDVGYDLSMAWNFLKNFGPEEWVAILGKVLAHGRHGAFNVQTWDQLRGAGSVVDKGSHYHDVFVSTEELDKAVAAAGHKIVTRESLSHWPMQEGGQGIEVAVWTRRVDAEGDPAGQGSPCAWCGLPLEEHKPPGESTLGRPKDRLCPVGDVTSQFYTPAVEGRARKFLQELSVEGAPCPDLWRYSLRWVLEGERSVPVLYREGRRVTGAWRVFMDVDRDADPRGGNANTA